MELKVLCECGQKFKFDVEPVNGQMPFTVNCPACNADATSTANTLIAGQLAVASPSTMTETSPPPPIAPASGGLRINRHAPEPVVPPTNPTPASVATAPPAIGSMRPFEVAAAQNPPKRSSFGMGLLGGLIGALAGSIIYLLIFKFTGWHFKLLAVGVGALAGWFADFLGKGEGSKELGGITAVLVVAGVVGAQYFVAIGWWREFDQARLAEARSAYVNSVAEAKEVMKAIPTGSGDEIRAYLVKTGGADGEKIKPTDITGDEIKDFREIQLPEYQGLASGQITKEQYEANHEIKTIETQADKDSEDSTFKSVFLLLFFTKWNIFSLAAAAALAFKLSTNA